MRTPILLSFATLLALPFAVSAQVYSWKDASGKTIYSDKPPLEKKAKTREVAAGVKSSGEPTTPAKPSADSAANGGAPEATGKSAEQAKAEADARQSLCDNARKRAIQLEAEKGIIVTKNEKGEQVPLVGDARKAELESARKDVEQWCK
jgi:hypothetical protein